MITIWHALAFGFAFGAGVQLFRAAWGNLDAIAAVWLHRANPTIVPCPLCHARAPFCLCEPCTHEKLPPIAPFSP